MPARDGYKVTDCEDELTPSWTTFAVSAVSGTRGTSMVITAANAYINQFDLLKVPSTGEVMLCTTVTGTAVTVQRGYGSTINAAAAETADILILGPAFAEGSLGTDLKTTSTQTVEVWNYCQLFRKSVELTRTLANTETYGGPERNLQRKKKGIELMRDFERMFLYGEALSDTAAGYDGTLTHARRTMRGINSFISTNYTNASGTLTESEFEAFLRTVFRYGGSSRYLFCSPLIISVISQWAQGKLQIFPKDKTLIIPGLCIKNLTKSVEVYMIDNTEERLSEKDLGWLAGILDGEGSFNIYNYGRKGIVVRLEVTNTDKNLVLEAKRISEKLMNHSIKLKTRIPKSQFEVKNKLRQWSFQLSNMKFVYALLSNIKNYLKSYKKQTANLICEYADLRKQRAYKSGLSQREQDILSQLGKIRNDYTSETVKSQDIV